MFEKIKLMYIYIYVQVIVIMSLVNMLIISELLSSVICCPFGVQNKNEKNLFFFFNRNFSFLFAWLLFYLHDLINELENYAQKYVDSYKEIIIRIQ